MLIQKVLNDGDEVTFEPFDITAATPGENLGRAEFSFCPVWSRGKIKTLWIVPLQQREAKNIYCVNGNFQNFMCSSWAHKGVKEPKVWMHFWCHEHKCAGFRVYVPENARRFSVTKLSTLQINFDL
jgi:hypothetical protein